MQIPLLWIYFLAGAAASALFFTALAFFIHRSSKERFKQELEELRKNCEEREAALEKSLEESNNETEKIEELLNSSRMENAALKERTEAMSSLQRRSEELEAILESYRSKTLALEKEISELQTLLESERRGAKRSLEELKSAKELMQKEFKILAAKIMEENSLRFGAISKEGVEQVLKPLQMQVSEFKKRIEQVHTEETKEMATLLNEIKSLKELNRQISEDATNLTKALKGESKKQGIWGEMVLERVLEASGLREGEEYEREVTMHDEQSRRFRPDVVVHLPDSRDIIIDAKTSLVAYEGYVNAEDDRERQVYAKRHLEAVKGHIDKLSDKSYAALEGVNTLDFIFMFMPIEGALMLALQEDPSLYDRAFSKHIVLVSPTTLLVALRAVENTWRRERQSQNALEIARQAGALYDKFVSFVEDLEKVGKQLNTVQKSYESAWRKLTDGRGNIVGRIQRLEELGAKATKSMPKKLVEGAERLEEIESKNS